MPKKKEITLYGKKDRYTFSLQQRPRTGNMSRVFMGRSQSSGILVAIKVLYRDLAEIPMYLSRFVNDVNSVIRISSPYIVHYYDYIEQNNNHHIIMEWIDGETIEDRIARNKANGKFFDNNEALSIIRQVLLGLAAIHGWVPAIIHRDIKPGNIIIKPDGQAKIIDFGIAKLGGTSVNENDQKLTGIGTFLGTLVYSSPEMIRLEHDLVGPPSDLWAVGLVLYEMLTNRNPFSAPTEESIRLNIKSQAILKEEHIDEGIFQIIQKATKKELKDRYQSAEAFVKDIDKILEGKPVRKSLNMKPDTWGPKEISIVVSVLILLIATILIISNL